MQADLTPTRRTSALPPRSWQLQSESVEAGDGFGMSLAVDGNTLLAGASKARGAVYVFSRADANPP